MTDIQTILRIEEALTELELNCLEGIYSNVNNNSMFEKIESSFVTAESLSKDLKLPLKVKGVFLTEGRPEERFYTSEQLRKSVENPENSTFPMMLDHEDDKAGMVIGRVTKIAYDPQVKGLRWWGHINSELFARNVSDGSIDQVSVTVYSKKDYSNDFGLVGENLRFAELSLVMDGAEPNNFIEVDE